MEDPDKSATEPTKTTYAGLRRQRLVGLGSEASVVGFLWVGYILGGAGIGYALDAHFHTSFLTPVLLLFGAVEGFREMMVTVSRLNKQPKPDSANAQGTASANAPSVVEYPLPDTASEPAPRQRIFAVPAPPEPSFGPSRKVSAAISTRSQTDQPDESEPQPSADVSSSEDLIKQLLNEHHDSSQ